MAPSLSSIRPTASEAGRPGALRSRRRRHLIPEPHAIHAMTTTFTHHPTAMEPMPSQPGELESREHPLRPGQVPLLDLGCLFWRQPPLLHQAVQLKLKRFVLNLTGGLFEGALDLSLIQPQDGRDPGGELSRG